MKHRMGMGLAMAFVCFATAQAQDAGKPDAVVTDTYGSAVLVHGLGDPWGMVWGPDNHLWITERSAKRIIRLHPDTGAVTVVATIPDAAPEPNNPHEGILGLALAPGFLVGDGPHYAYVYYTYRDAADARKGRVVRFTYDPAATALADPSVVLENLPAGEDHNGGRLLFGPDGKLYLSKGELGHNQGAHACHPIEAQRLPTAAELAAKDWTAYVGKVLRLNVDGTVPADNPTLDGVRSHVFTYGHRNPQGLVFVGDTLFSSEQGPSSDDEINRLESGCNYGWPHVAGFQDDAGYRYANWSAAAGCPKLPFDANVIAAGVPTQKETDWPRPANYRDPVKTFYTVPTGYDFNDARYKNLENAYVAWPTIAPSSVTYYPKDGPVGALRHSLLVTSLKNGTLYVVRLHGDGLRAQGDVQTLFRTQNRYRAVVASPDGKRIFIATDLSGNGHDAEGKPTNVMQNPGAILVFTHTGPTMR